MVLEVTTRLVQLLYARDLLFKHKQRDFLLLCPDLISQDAPRRLQRLNEQTQIGRHLCRAKCLCVCMSVSLSPAQLTLFAPCSTVRQDPAARLELTFRTREPTSRIARTAYHSEIVEHRSSSSTTTQSILTTSIPFCTSHVETTSML